MQINILSQGAVRAFSVKGSRRELEKDYVNNSYLL